MTAGKRILLSVCGLSPQVITETIFCLAVKKPCNTRFVPDEVHVVTTNEGALQINRLLLSETPGWFHQLRRDYQLPAIRFNQSTIHIVKNDRGQLMPDIRSDTDSSLIADTLTRCVAEFTSDPTTTLHVSIAGGRKTMGFLAGYTLSLFARPQDQLSHVLVNADFESHTEFFYPTPYDNPLTTHNDQTVNARRAEVSLAMIPIISQRNHLSKRLLSGRVGYSDIVAETQWARAQPQLELNVNTRTLGCHNRYVKLPDAQLALYTLLVYCKVNGTAYLDPATRAYGKLLLQIRYQIQGSNSSRAENAREALQEGIEIEYFRQQRSKINSALESTLGEEIAKLYCIIDTGPRGNKLYGIATTPEHINLIGFPQG